MSEDLCAEGMPRDAAPSWWHRAGRAAAAFLAAVATLCLPAPAVAAASGLWVAASGDYLVLMQDGTNGTAFGFQVPQSMSSLRVWIGSGTSASLSLKSLVEPADSLSASYTASTMTGSTQINGATATFSANLALAWVASEYAGVWQRSTGAGDYLVFCILNAGGARLGVQIDITVKSDKTYSYAVYTGTVNGDQFNGVSLAGSGVGTRLEFGNGTLAGQYLSGGRPPQATPFTATQIVKLSQ